MRLLNWTLLGTFLEPCTDPLQAEAPCLFSDHAEGNVHALATSQTSPDSECFVEQSGPCRRASCGSLSKYTVARNKRSSNIARWTHRGPSRLGDMETLESLVKSLWDSGRNWLCEVLEKPLTRVGSSALRAFSQQAQRQEQKASRNGPFVNIQPVPAMSSMAAIHQNMQDSISLQPMPTMSSMKAIYQKMQD
eukprot:6474896-Amphidinium_carterae.1